VNPLLPAHGIAAAAAEAGARLVLASADQIHALADLGAQPSVLIEGPHGALGSRAATALTVA
jgi:hypothetical protein